MHYALQLVSLAVGDPPAPDDDAMYLLMKNGWHGNAQTAAKFREVVEKDPNNAHAWMFLGMSLYETKDYSQAAGAFQKCAEHSANNLTWREWATVWQAQMYDLLGDRENALRLYRTVAESKNAETMMFGQYRIGPLSAAEWARRELRALAAPCRQSCRTRRSGGSRSARACARLRSGKNSGAARQKRGVPVCRWDA